MFVLPNIEKHFLYHFVLVIHVHWELLLNYETSCSYIDMNCRSNSSNRRLLYKGIPDDIKRFFYLLVQGVSKRIVTVTWLTLGT